MRWLSLIFLAGCASSPPAAPLQSRDNPPAETRQEEDVIAQEEAPPAELAAPSLHLGPEGPAIGWLISAPLPTSWLVEERVVGPRRRCRSAMRIELLSGSSPPARFFHPLGFLLLLLLYGGGVLLIREARA